MIKIVMVGIASQLTSGTFGREYEPVMRPSIYNIELPPPPPPPPSLTPEQLAAVFAALGVLIPIAAAIKYFQGWSS